MTVPADPRIKALAPLLRRVRTDVTAVKKADGTTAWTHDKLTKELVAKHLNGGPARGVCPIKEGENTTMAAVLDFDSHGGETPWEGMVAAAVAVSEAATMFGVYPTPFRSSGGRGIHLICLWELPQDAASVRALLCDILAACGYVNGTKGVAVGQIEVFPKQDKVDLGGYGNQFILPLANKSLPLDAANGLALMDTNAKLTWRMSEPVPGLDPIVAAPAAQTSVGTDIPLAVLKDALAHIPNDGGADSPDYDQWRDILFGIHHATGGSEEGLQIAIAFSARNPRHNEKFLRERMWPYAKPKPGGKTARSILAAARAKGWVQNSALWFDDLTAGDLPVQTTQEKTGEVTAVETAPPRPRPAFKTDKAGNILVTMPNLLMAVRRDDLCGGALGYDSFRDEVMIDRSMGLGLWQSFTDADYVWLRERLEGEGFKPIGREVIRDAVHAVAQANKFDSAALWLSRLEWDGVPRVERFLIDYFRTVDTPYTRAVALYVWTALAGRLMVPGVKADMVPIAVGLQGVGKSTAVEAMAPSVEYFCEISFGEKEDDLARKLRGTVIAEFGELRGLHTKELEAIKAFISRAYEQWVPKFKEFKTQYARRCIFFGTTNQTQFLADTTGNRRWLPFDAAVTGPVQVAAIRADNEQLWAEARVMFEAQGVLWQQADELAKEVHGQHEMQDAWEPRVANWMVQPGFGGELPPEKRPYLTGIEVLTEALGFEAKHVSRREEMRIAAVLTRLGYSRSRRRINGNQFWGWWKE